MHDDMRDNVLEAHDGMCSEGFVRGATPGRDVLFLLSTLGVGGSEMKIVRLANALVASQQHRVTLAYLNGPDTLLQRLHPGVEVVHLHRTGKFSPGALGRLSELIQRKRIDTVVCVNLYASLYAGLLAKFSRRLRHVRFLASLNTTFFGSRSAERRMMLYRPLLKSMDLLIFGAEYQRSLWQREHLGQGAPESCVLYNGVDTAYFRKDQLPPWRPPGWPSNRIIVGTVGRLSREKSHDHLIRAIAELSRRGLDVGAVIVGEGKQALALRQLARELNVDDRVHLSGPVGDVRAHLAGFDIFVITSTSVETFSNAALEALAMDCPVVTSRIGGMAEMLVEGGGLTYEPGNIPELTAHLHELAISGQRRVALAREGRSVVMRRFSLQAMVEAFRSLIAPSRRAIEDGERGACLHR